MRDLTESEKWQIFGAPMAGTSFTKLAELFAFMRATISRTMTEFKQHGKPLATEAIPAGLRNLQTETNVH